MRRVPGPPPYDVAQFGEASAPRPPWGEAPPEALPAWYESPRAGRWLKWAIWTIFALGVTSSCIALAHARMVENGWIGVERAADTEQGEYSEREIRLAREVFRLRAVVADFIVEHAKLKSQMDLAESDCVAALENAEEVRRRR